MDDNMYMLPYPRCVELSSEWSMQVLHMNWALGGRWADVCKTIVIVIHNRLKFTSLLLVSSWLRGRVLDWRLSQPGFDASYGNLVCLATLMSSDRTKQICLWMTIYIYIYTKKSQEISTDCYCAIVNLFCRLGLPLQMICCNLHNAKI